MTWVSEQLLTHEDWRRDLPLLATPPNGDYRGLVGPEDIAGRCVCRSFTTTTCTYTLKMTPRIHPQDNTTAGTWTVRAHALANDGDYITKDSAAKAKVLRNSRLTVNASPEPVKKNKTISVTGALTRANWETYKYAGYTKQPAKLQFKEKGTSTYKTLKAVTTDSKGSLRTTTKATTDGYFRYSFAGTSITPAVPSAASSAWARQRETRRQTVLGEHAARAQEQREAKEELRADVWLPADVSRRLRAIAARTRITPEQVLTELARHTELHDDGTLPPFHPN
ncbi:hypothetical protein ACFU76_35775 [Streptomyces sp. NPDC057539]|uniref:hypothetical protein n=1 Tax=Streptomyces sp. NPDC057539 TaxID=3346159 RepID=UPI0036CA7A9B